jgi:ppGpp synthetase/RelA/SpoT-type nucleotidyltranferase
MPEFDLTKLPDLMDQFSQKSLGYQVLEQTFGKILSDLALQLAPGGKSEARRKTPASFAEKCIRKNYQKPFEQMTDLVGGRIVAYTRKQTDDVCRWIEDHEGVELEIDWANSLNTLSRLRAGEFGYSARHYIVRLKGSRVLGHDIEPAIRTIKCEFQICTYLEHVWAAIGHDRLYKTGLTPPKTMERQVAAVMAMLESADDAFGRTVLTLDRYIQSFQAHLSPDEVKQELARQNAILAVDPEGSDAVRLHYRIGQLHCIVHDPDPALKEFQIALQKHEHWAKAVPPVLLPPASEILRERAKAAIMAGTTDDARNDLKRAIEINPSDFEAYARLGGTYLAKDPEQAMNYFAKAHELAPEDPTVLGGYVEANMLCHASAESLEMLRGSLITGIAECQKRMELGVHLPTAYFEEGRLGLYLKPREPWDALGAYCRAIAACERWQSIDDELKAVDRMIEALQSQNGDLLENDRLRGFVWVQRLLRLGLMGKLLKVNREPVDQSLKIGSSDQRRRDDVLEQLRKDIAVFATEAKNRPAFKIDRPILLAAGGCDRAHADAIRACEKIMDFAIEGFVGTIIGGGTKVGIGELVAEAAARSSGRANVKLMAYLPEELPIGDVKEDASRFKIITVRHDKREYTALGPMQTWADLLLAGIDPSEIRLLGINGGQLSAFEFRLALAMGAIAGVVQKSGREAEKLLPDPFWHNFRGLAPLPKDRATLAAFVNSAHPDVLKPRSNAEAMAKSVHETYRQNMLKEPWNLEKDQSMRDWEKLPKPLKRSNLHQAAYSIMILRRAGYEVPELDKTNGLELISFAGEDKATKDKVEEMAELEHGRYCAERLSDGWRWGPKKDIEKRLNPTLIPWGELSEEQKTKDRTAVREFPRVLKMAGLGIVAVAE